MIRTVGLKTLTVLLAVSVVAACGKKNKNPLSPSDPTLQSVEIVGKQDFVVGETLQLQAIARFSDGTQQQVTTQATWANFNSGAISVSPTGLLQALKVGKCGVVATYQGRSGTLSVIVRASDSGDPDNPGGPGPGPGDDPDAPASYFVQGSTSVAVGQTVQWDAVLQEHDSLHLVTVQSTWTSFQPEIASISGPGQIVGVASGLATIQATFDGRTTTGQIQVTQTVQPPPTVTALTISGTPCSTVGGSAQLQAIAQMSNGTTQNVTTQAAWGTGNGAVAQVSSTGGVSCVGTGSTTISASFGGSDASVPVNVAAPDLIGLELEVPVNLTVADLLNGDPVLGARVFGLYSDGSRQEVTSACASTGCLTSPTNLLNIDGMGTSEVVLLLVQGLIDPNHQVNATYGGYTANSGVTLQLPVLEQVVIGNGGPLSLNLTDNKQLPALQTTFDQGIASSTDAGVDGASYEIALGGELSDALDALPLGAGAVLRTTVLDPVLSTLGVTGGQVDGNAGLLNSLLATLSGNPALAPVLGPGGALPLDMTASLNGVTSDPVRMNLGN